MILQFHFRIWIDGGTKMYGLEIMDDNFQLENGDFGSYKIWFVSLKYIKSGTRLAKMLLIEASMTGSCGIGNNVIANLFLEMTCQNGQLCPSVLYFSEA